MAPPNSLTPSANDSEIYRTLKLLKESKEKIELNKRYRNVTLVLGIAGAEKSKFVQWLAGDNTKLISEKIPGSVNEFVVKDKIGISNLTTQSIFPKLVVDRETCNAYYDCPEFNDIRSTSSEIASTYFIKYVTDYVENLRLLFVIGYPAVKVGVDRRQFIELLKHSTNLVRNVPKFHQSIALVVTMVDNTPYQDEKGQLVYKSDESIIESIVEFLSNVQEELKQNSANENYDNFINAILQKDVQNGYSKIGIYRRPEKPGPLNEIPVLLADKVKLIKMIKQLQLTPIEKKDFGYSISDNSRNVVLELVNIVKDCIWKDADSISQLIIRHYQQSVEDIRVNMHSFDSNNFEILVPSMDEVKIFALKNLKAADRIASVLASDLSNRVTTKTLLEKLNYSLNAFEIDNIEDKVKQISTKINQLDFLQNDYAILTMPWQNLLRKIIDSLKTSSKNIQSQINGSAGKLVKAVQSTINGIARELWLAKLLQMQSTDIQKLPGQLKREIVIVKSQTGNLNNLEQLASAIDKSAASLGLESGVLKSNTLNLLNYGKYLRYLNAISDRQLDIWSPEWTTPLVTTLKSFTGSLDWYLFLNNLYSKLGEYDFQQNLSLFNVANLHNWGQGQFIQKEIYIDEHNFSQFLKILSQYNITRLDALKEGQIAQWQLNELNQLLSLTLKHGKYMHDCDFKERKLTITGDYVKLSDLNQKLVDMCGGENISTVNIFASNTMFIDGSLNGMGNKLKLSLMAPKLEVVGKRTINLDGSPGKQHNPPKARNSQSQGFQPKFGKPGLAGGSAGSLFAVAQLVVNRNGLTITANGGVGGTGQEGGNGSMGENGKNAQEPTSSCRITGAYKLLNTIYDQKGLIYRIYGSNGSEGGIGADGGFGGIGGKPGTIKLYNLNESTIKQIETHQGSSGSGGSGGLGGYQGIHGNDLVVYCNYFELDGPKTMIYDKVILDNIKYDYSNRAQSGADGANRHNISEPEPPSLILHPAYIINDYKKYLRENLSGANARFKNNSIIPLIDQVDEKFSDTYDFLSFVGELEDLEQQTLVLKNKANSLHFYESLSNRVITYVSSPNPSEQSVKYKKLFNYLSAAILGKLYDLKAIPKTNLIIDVESFVNYVKENIDILNNLKKEHNKHEIVEEQTQKYRQNIEQQISEARDFIENEIKPEFDRIEEEADAKIDKLLKDTIELEKKAEENKEELIKNREKLEKELVLRAIFTGIKSLSQLAVIAGPQAAAVGTVVGGITSIAEGFALDDETSKHKEFKLPASIKDNIKLAETKFKEYFDKGTKDLKTKLDKITSEIDPVLELSDISKQLNDIKLRLPDTNSAQTVVGWEDTVIELEEETRKVLEAQELKMKHESKEKWSKRSVKAINYANKIASLCSTAFEMYSKIESDKEEIIEADKAIEKVNNELKIIDAYKKEIIKTISPDMAKLMSDFSTIKNSLDTKSLAALDVQKWKAQNMLRNLKVGIHKLIKGQEVEDDMMRCFEKLDDAMNIIIKIYDRIQNFQQQQQLTDFMGNIASPAANSIQIDDDQLLSAVNKLDIVIRSNIVMDMFNSIVAALKQMVFPYARHYLDTLTLPSEQSLSDAYIDEMISNTNTALEKIKQKIILNKTTISEVDENTHDFDFNSIKPCIQSSFYVWPNAEHSSTLAKLLSGESVTLKADIRHSDPDKDAIKFLKVELKFKTENSTIQAELDAKLEMFKISVIHLGNSYYRYGGKYYVINHEPLKILYSFAKRSDGSPIESSVAFKKIQKGTLTLSPYAMWKIQLIKMHPNASFSQLAAYKDAYDLELVGPGRFIENQVALNNDLKLDKYYNEYIDKETSADAIDLVEQYASRQMYGAQVKKHVICKAYLTKHKAKSNLLHRFSDSDNLTSQNSTRPHLYISQLNKTISSYLSGNRSSTTDTHISQTRFEYAKQPRDTNNTDFTQTLNSVNVQNNLLLSQLMVGLVVGKNKTLSNESYMSPKLSRIVQVERLARSLVPTLSQTSATRYRSNQIHNQNNQWHRDLFTENEDRSHN